MEKQTSFYKEVGGQRVNLDRQAERAIRPLLANMPNTRPPRTKN